MFPKEEEEEDKRRVRPRSLMITLALVGGAMLMPFYDGFGGLSSFKIYQKHHHHHLHHEFCAVKNSSSCSLKKKKKKTNVVYVLVR